jgi:hypothetical protein
MNRSRIFSLAVRYSIMAIITLLIVEFLLGMWVNLYAAVPVGTKLNLSQQPDFAGKLELGIHLIVGVLLGVVSFVILIFVALLKKAVAAVLAVVGLLSIIVAGFSGLDFTNGGYSNGAESFVMAVSTILTQPFSVNESLRVIFQSYFSTILTFFFGG